jgi:hypothetical protein
MPGLVTVLCICSGIGADRADPGDLAGPVGQVSKVVAGMVRLIFPGEPGRDHAAAAVAEDGRLRPARLA